MKDKTLTKYLLWAFGLGWALQIAASWAARNTALPESARQLGFTLALAVSMFAPLAAVRLAKGTLKSLGWKPGLRKNWRTYLTAWFLPALLCTLGAAIYFLLFPASFDTSGASIRATTPAEALQQYEAQGITVPALLLIMIVSSLLYAPLINAIPAVGEEAGWRGFLTPRLKERFGRSRGLLLSGCIWGAWHWPVMLLAGYEYGLEYWGAPVLGMLLFCVITTAMGILLDLLYEKTGSLWAPALAHGALNAFAAVPSLFLNPACPERPTLGPLPVGVIGGLPLILLALFVLLKKTPAGTGDS